jgi:hypothetical protein
MKLTGWFAAAGILACAACGGGGGSAAPASAPTAMPTPAGTTIPAGPRAYTGARTVTVTGSPQPGGLGAATYTANAVETSLAPASAAPAGTTVDRQMQITYAGGAPPAGMRLQTQTLDRYAASAPAGLTLLAEGDTTVALDQDAATVPGTQFTDTRTLVTTYPGAPAIVPAAAGTVPFPFAASAHLVERSVETTGPILGATGRDVDSTRTTAGDGGFDETGRFSVVGAHAKHQHADGSATSHDQLPGFSLRDVAVSAPSAGANGMQLAVTLQTQGRTVGNPPIASSTFTTPVWYAPAPLASATLYDTIGSLSPFCGASSTATARRLNLARGTVDVTGGTLAVTNDENYVDANGVTICRVVWTVTTFSDVTTGAFVAQIDDRLALHYTGSASATSSARRGTR